jgi:hypothetical protein
VRAFGWMESISASLQSRARPGARSTRHTALPPNEPDPKYVPLPNSPPKREELLLSQSEACGFVLGGRALSQLCPLVGRGLITSFLCGGELRSWELRRSPAEPCPPRTASLRSGRPGRVRSRSAELSQFMSLGVPCLPILSRWIQLEWNSFQPDLLPLMAPLRLGSALDQLGSSCPLWVESGPPAIASQGKLCATRTDNLRCEQAASGSNCSKSLALQTGQQ